MEDFSSPPPPPPKKSLSVDRAAFLLLRVKKAFKKKRQQRKDKQTQLASNSGAASASRASRKIPPPLLRSRTLPAIIVPGIPVVSLHTDASTAALHFGNFNCNYNTICGSSGYTSASSTHNNNNSSKINNNNHAAALKSLNLPKDDSSFVYRRKSSGSTPHSMSVVAAAVAASGGDTGQSTDYPGASSHHTHPPHMLGDYMQSSSDDFECQADGSVLLRIPAPHVVAARAYRLAASRKRTPPSGAAGSSSSGSGDSRHHPFSQHSQSLRYTSHDYGAEAAGSHTSYSCSSTPVGGFGGSSSYSSGALHLPTAAAAAATTSSSSSSSSSNSTALTRLAKLLHQSSATAVTKLTPHTLPANMPPHPETLPIEEAPRRLSWERRKDSSALQRSASIDSFAEIVWSDSPRPSLDIPRPAVPFSKRPSASSLFSNSSTTSAAYNTQLNINYGVGCGSAGDASHHHQCSSGGSATSSGNSRRESLLSPSSTRRNKMSRIINDNVTLPSSQVVHASATLRSDRARTKPPPPLSSSTPPPTPARSSLPRSPPSAQQHNATAEYTSDTEVTLRRKPLEPASYASSSLTYWRNSAIGSPSKRHNIAASQPGRPHTHRRCGSYEINIARIRSSKSYTADELKDMEYLLPPPHAPSTNLSVSSSTSSSAASLTTSSSLGRGATTNKNSAATRHAHPARPLSTPHPSAGGIAAMSNPKNAKLYDAQKDVPLVAGDENKYEGNIQVPLRGGSAGLPHQLVNHRYTVDGGEACMKAPPLNGTSLKGGLVGNTPHRNKMSKKQLKLAQAQLDKLTQINLHLHALFSAVEHGHLDKARTILESTDVDVNSINTDGLSALDVAVLSNNRSMTKMLLQHGAAESSQYSAADTTIGSKLNGLLKDAESRIHELSSAVDPSSCPAPSFASRPSISSIIIGNTGSSVTGCTGNEIDKQIGIWERRVKGLRRMLLGWDQARPPDAPSSVTVDVIGDNSIAVQALEPFDGAIATKFKVQWSTRADFGNVVGEREVIDWTSFHGTMGAQCQIGGLTQGRRYFIRSACGNVKGWGPYKMSIPSSIVPSSWRDLNKHEDRYVGRQRVLDNLFTAVRVARPPDASELSLDTTHRRNPKKKTTIKQLFSVASKFQKNLRRGIYLASIVYCEDKVLVTSEDFLPVIEIDETYPSTLHSDYHWLLKVACTWEDVKSLRTDMERNLTSAVHFRTKLLSAICQMQSALGLTDLGQLYYKPLRDSHGTIVLTCIQAVRSQKAVSILNSRWLPVNKLQKKIVALMEDFTIHDMLISSIGDQIHYHQSSMERLPPGLYLGYLKMQCSVEQIQVVVPAKTPNVLPHYKVRDNSHITAEEWQVLKRSKAGPEHAGPLSLSLELESSGHVGSPSEVQKLFLYDLTAAAHKLFAAMNIKPEEALNHRLYDIEVIEHSRDISFLIICPSVEFTCAAPGQSELLLQREDLASLSIQAFEMIHLRTYQPGIIHKYARLSCILELDTALANYSHREAFSTTELQTAKERLAKLQELTANLNTVWKSVRWLMDVIAFARDKNAHSSVSMKEILECGGASRAEADRLPGGTPLLGKHQLLQPPTTAAATSPAESGSTTTSAKFTKNNCARGSWPGPAAEREAGQLASAEHSKSEQNLGFRAVKTPVAGPTLAPPQLLAPTEPAAASSASSMRKNSGDSVSSQYTTRSYYSAADSTAGSNSDLNSVFAIPPSRSADTLALGSAEAAKQAAAGSHRKRTSSNIAQVTTPTPLATSHSSSMSVPYLARDPAASYEAGKSLLASSQATKESSQSAMAAAAEPPIIVKVKAASSSNLRDGCLYLKTTLSALQTEIKTTTGAEAESALEGKAICSSSTKSLSRQSSEDDNESTASFCTEQSGAAGGASLATASSTSGIIQVYTAYNTGLASGTSLKLHVTPKTSAREVINLVVKQLNMAAVLKGNNGPIYTSEMMDNFCLVAVIGARERCLRDDFKPLQLQNPWKKGRLYVRQKHELLAAIEHSNRKSHLI